MHSDKKIISIITVTLNAERNIEKTLTSVQNQYLAEAVEHVVVDGGSQDSTLSVIRSKFASVKIVEIDDTGIYDAMNKAINLASGDYIIFLNSGDIFCDRNALNLYLAACRENNDIISSFYKIDGRLNRFNITKNDINYFVYGMPVSHQTLCIRKCILKKTPFNIKFQIAADYDNLIKLKLNNNYNFHCIERILIEMEPGGFSDVNRFSALREQLMVLNNHNLLGLRNVLYYFYRFNVEAVKCLIRY
jgi:glycosyltransferase involved in cell wall biosynthesis